MSEGEKSHVKVIAKAQTSGQEEARAVPPDELVAGLEADAAVWLEGVELMVGDLAEGELLPARVFLCGGGARLPEISGALVPAPVSLGILRNSRTMRSIAIDSSPSS